MTTFKKQLQRDEQGIRPLYRPKSFQKEERRTDKKLSKVAWYRPNHTVLFIPPTPNSELKKQFQQVAEETERDSGIKVRVVERAGTKIRHLLPGLQHSDQCNQKKCFLHSSGGTGNHNAESIVYRANCVTCLEQGPSSKPDADGVAQPIAERKPGTTAYYVGESGRSILFRGEQHLNAIENPTSHQDNAFVKHAAEHHLGEVPEYKMSLVGQFPKTLERQVWEGVLIRRGESTSKKTILMNSKLDHYAPAVGKVTISNALDD